MESQFDKEKSNKYSKFTREGNLKTFVLSPSFFKVLGDTTNKTVLDVGCGDGYFTAKIKRCGASKVVGIDISEDMIKLAKQREDEEQIGIEYLVHDATKMPKLEEFDIATATLLLHYARTKEELQDICHSIAKNLKKEGRLVALNNNPLIPVFDHSKYGEVAKPKGELKEGVELIIELDDGETKFSFSNYYWKKETYEEALRLAGFIDIKWHNLIISKEGIEKFGSEYWQDYLDNQRLTILEAIKA